MVVVQQTLSIGERGLRKKESLLPLPKRERESEERKHEETWARVCPIKKRRKTRSRTPCRFLCFLWDGFADFHLCITRRDAHLLEQGETLDETRHFVQVLKFGPQHNRLCNRLICLVATEVQFGVTELIVRLFHKQWNQENCRWQECQTRNVARVAGERQRDVGCVRRREIP